MDLANPILSQRAQPPSIIIPVYFKGPSVLVKPIERPLINIAFKMGEKRAEPMTTISEGAITTYMTTSTSTSNSIKASNLLS